MSKLFDFVDKYQKQIKIANAVAFGVFVFCGFILDFINIILTPNLFFYGAWYVWLINPYFFSFIITIILIIEIFNSKLRTSMLLSIISACLSFVLWILLIISYFVIFPFDTGVLVFFRPFYNITVKIFTILTSIICTLSAVYYIKQYKQTHFTKRPTKQQQINELKQQIKDLQDQINKHD